MKKYTVLGILIILIIFVSGCTNQETIACENPDGAVGDTYNLDGCNTCICNEQGKWECTELACNSIPKPPEFPN